VRGFNFEVCGCGGGGGRGGSGSSGGSGGGKADETLARTLGLGILGGGLDVVVVTGGGGRGGTLGFSFFLVS
jgi:hypothetical protein